MPEYPQLFSKKQQPRVTRKVLEDLEERGLIVPPTSLHKSKRRTTEVTNRTAGEVVGYSLLAKKFKDSEITQQDARVLLLIEANRKGGPRDTHIARLATNSFATDKTELLEKIDQWAKNQG